MTERWGLCYEVNKRELGSELRVAAVATDTVLEVESVADFTEGASFTIGAEEHVIDAIDTVARTVTTAAPVAGNHDAETPVLLLGGDGAPVPEVAAYVATDGVEDGTIWANVIHTLVDALPEGIRAPEAREQVKVRRDEGGRWELYDIRNKELVRDGSYIDPTTIFAEGGIRVVSALPALPDGAYPEGAFVYLIDLAAPENTGLYRSTGAAWTDEDILSGLDVSRLRAGTINAAIVLAAQSIAEHFIIRTSEVYTPQTPNRAQTVTPVAGTQVTELGWTWPSATLDGNTPMVGVSVRYSGVESVINIEPPDGWKVAGAASRLVVGSPNQVYLAYLFYIPNAAPRSGTETVRFTGFSGGPVAVEATLHPMEVSGLEIVETRDVFALNNGNSSSPDSGTTGAAAQDDEYLVGFLANEQDTAQTSPTNDFTQVNTAASGHATPADRVRGGLYEKVDSDGGTANVGASLSAARHWAGCIATFRIAPTNVAAPPVDSARIHVRDRGDGKLQAVLRFPTGIVRLLYDEGGAGFTTHEHTGADGSRAIDPANLAGPVEAFAVGGLYFNTTGGNPATELGYGTWAAFGTGRMLVGFDAGQTEFDTVEETGGAKTHVLTEAEIPGHIHTTPTSDGASNTQAGGGNRPANADGVTGSTGGGQGHNNLPPYIVVHIWKRTA